MDWINEEFEYTDLGDKRLDNRLKKIVEQRISNPEGSLSESMGEAKNLKSAYRFYDNQYFDYVDIQKSHRLKTLERMKKEKVVLSIQDTTSVDYTNLIKTKGLGILEGKKSKGVLIHSTLAINTEREPLGILKQEIWSRKSKEERGETRHDRDIPIEEKESYRWVRSLKTTNDFQQQLPETMLVNVGDRESDIYDYFHTAQKYDQKVLVRAHYNREIEDSEERMIDYIMSQPVSGIVELKVEKSKERESRIAKISLRYGSVLLNVPRRKHNLESFEKVRVNVIIAREEAELESPINWILITNLEVASYDSACEKLNWYSIRWQIEVFHKLLKSGCKIEKRQFGSVEKIKKYLSVDSIVAWKLLYLTMCGRGVEDLPCTNLFSDLEYTAIYCFVNKSKELPSEIPSLKDMKNMIASLGGFLGRKSDGEPGIKVMWRGLSKVSIIVEAWKMFR